MAGEEAEVAAGGRACSLTTVKWGTTENRKPFTYAVFASPCNVQQPLTDHS